MELRIKLKEVLEKKGMTQSELSEKAGVRQAVISEMIHNQRLSIKKEHITKICEVLEIKNVGEILELVHE